MAGLKNHFVGRQRELEFHQALGFAFKVIKLLEKLFRVTGFKVVVTLLDFVLMEDVAVGERVLFAQSVGPVRVDQVKDVVAVLQIHRQAFKPVGDFTGDGLTLKAAHLLEVRKLRDFHTVHPHFPAKAPGAERRVFPVVFHETDVVDLRIDAERSEGIQIEINDIDGSGL